MRLSLICIFIAYCCSNSVFASQDSKLDEKAIREGVLESGVWRGKNQQSAFDWGVSLDLGLAHFQVFKGLGVAFNHLLQVEPTFQGPFYHRVDRWSLNSDLNPGDILNSAVSSPVSLKISRKNQILFIRYFANRSKALNAAPYDLSHLPLSAKTALNKLQPGDFVSIPAELNLIMSAELATSHPIINANAGSYWLMRSQFEIHILRMSGSQVRLRMIALRDHRREFPAAKIGIGFQLYRFGLSQAELSSQYELSLAEGSRSVENGDIFFMDFIFDLGNQEACDAYEAILASKFKWKNVSSLSEPNEKKWLDDAVIGDASMAEAICRQDLELDLSKRRVHCVFKGFSNYSREASRIKLGTRLLFFEKNGLTSTNDLMYLDAQGEQLSFFLVNSSASTGAGFLFGLREKSVKHDLGLLFRSTESPRVQNFEDFFISVQVQDRLLDDREKKLFKNFLDLNLKSDHMVDMKLNNWFGKSDLENAYLQLKVVMNARTMEDFGRKSLMELEQAYLDYLDKKRDLIFSQEGFGELNFIGFLHPDNEQMIGLLYELFRHLSGSDMEAKVDLIKKLKNNQPFLRHGLGFLWSLASENKGEEGIFLDLEMRANHKQPYLKKDLGSSNTRQYPNFEIISSLLKDFSFGLEGEALEIKKGQWPPSRAVHLRKLRKKEIFQLLYAQ